MKHLINWAEIPATDIQRAAGFYSAILRAELQQLEMAGNRYALFPAGDKFNCGALVQGEHYKPAADGVVIYLDGGNDLDTVLGKVTAAGGQVIMEKTYVSAEAGYIGMFIDTEGNKIGLQNL